MIEDQYLLGQCLMIAPILLPNVTSRNIYFPVNTLWKSCYADYDNSNSNSNTSSYNTTTTNDNNNNDNVIKGSKLLNVTNILLTDLPPCYILLRYNNNDIHCF